MPKGSYRDFDDAWLAGHMAKMGQRVEPLADATPEEILLSEIRKVAKPYGWLPYHTYDSRKSEEGFPDLVLCNGVSLLMYELKDNYKKPTKEQALWLSMLTHTGLVECGIWRPRDWESIVQRLTRGRR